MPVSVGQIMELCEKIAPQEDAEEWDNVGLLAGSASAPVSKVLCALDLTEAVVHEAVDRGAEMILTHHPILFRGRKNLRADDAEGRMLRALVRADIAHYAMHTNYDNASPGVNDALAAALGLKNVTAVDRCMLQGLTECKTFGEFADHVENALGGPVRRYGRADSPVRLISVLGGAGGSYLEAALEASSSVFVTGEISYHAALGAVDDGMCVLEAGHAATERPGILALATALQKAADAVQYPICVLNSEVGLFL